MFSRNNYAMNITFNFLGVFMCFKKVNNIILKSEYKLSAFVIGILKTSVAVTSDFKVSEHYKLTIFFYFS